MIDKNEAIYLFLEDQKDKLDKLDYEKGISKILFKINPGFDEDKDLMVVVPITHKESEDLNDRELIRVFFNMVKFRPEDLCGEYRVLDYDLFKLGLQSTSIVTLKDTLSFDEIQSYLNNKS